MSSLPDLKPDLVWETKFGYPSLHVVGVDEVGRGCLAGPVVAGAVVLPSGPLPPWAAEITDSKKLTPTARERLAPLIEAWAVASAIGVASVEEIDEINIYHAAHLAMKRAIEKVCTQLGAGKLSHVLIDGNALPKNLPAPATAIVKGDLKCMSIASSSIIAKVWRDSELVSLDARYPGYGLGVHKGYGTPAHLKALRQLGPTPIHRRSFAPVAAAAGVSASPQGSLAL